MKKILVTGSAGFVASHFVECILEKTDWHVIGLDSFRHRGDSLRIQSDMDPKRYDIYACDLSAPISYRLAAKIGPVDFVVNFASDSHVDRSIADPVGFVQNNVNIALNMLEFARANKPKSFIQISTDEVYGPAPGTHTHSEWSPIVPSNPYSASKAAQEAIAISYWRTFGVPLTIVNCMNLFGPRQDPEKYIPMLITKINSGEEVTVHGSEQQPGSRFYIHARNLADGILHLINTKEPKMYEDRHGEVALPDRYNIVGEAEVDNLTLAKTVAKMLGKPLHYRFVDFHSTRPGHDARYGLCGAKMKTTGWNQPISFEESLKKTIEWTLAHPDWLR